MKLPAGPGWYMWILSDCEGGNPSAIAAAAQAAGLGHVLIKIADGASWRYNVVNGVDLVPPVARALQDVGIMVLGWVFVYGSNPGGEGRLAIARIAELRAKGVELAGLVVNAEMAYRDLPNNKAAATQYMQMLRSDLGEQYPIGLSSFRYPLVHPTFPWREFLQICDFNMPQVYWMGATNAGAQLIRSVEQNRALPVQRPIIPTGAAFKEAGWAAQPREVLEFLDTAKGMGFSGVNFWEWGRTRRDLPANWDVVSGYDYVGGNNMPGERAELIVEIFGAMGSPGGNSLPFYSDRNMDSWLLSEKSTPENPIQKTLRNRVDGGPLLVIVDPDKVRSTQEIASNTPIWESALGAAFFGPKGNVRVWLWDEATNSGVSVVPGFDAWCELSHLRAPTTTPPIPIPSLEVTDAELGAAVRLIFKAIKETQ
jgi:hypothetical protein